MLFFVFVMISRYLIMIRELWTQLLYIFYIADLKKNRYIAAGSTCVKQSRFCHTRLVLRLTDSLSCHNISFHIPNYINIDCLIHTIYHSSPSEGNSCASLDNPNCSYKPLILSSISFVLSSYPF